MDPPSPESDPVMPTPDGGPPDFDGGSPLQRTVVIVYSVSFAIATVLLTLRLYTSAYLVRRFGFDEFLVLLSWTGSIIMFVFMCLAMRTGFGKHVWDVSKQQLLGYTVRMQQIALIYFWPPTLTKLALLVLYHRINPSPIFRTCIYVMAGSLLTYTVTFTVLIGGPCNPLTNKDSTCLNDVAMAQAILNILSDVALIAMPVPTIMSLGMPLRQKMNVFAILALGSGATIISIVRINYIKSMTENPDVTWVQAAASVWSCVELNLGITCNCLALMKPFVRRHLPWLLTRGSQKGSGSNEFMASRSIGGRSFRPWRGDGAVGIARIYSAGQYSVQSIMPAGGRSIHVEHQYEVEFQNMRGVSPISIHLTDEDKEDMA